ncbi:uncharacterized protein BO80DRAFT_72319 [Aspergillus ibericus CBS 121593]|uniref:Uncharacterized protein n=1 Tax=Aspergillus ibericus CBS 121593 TaxID=1448316 RepID=A0A395H0S0_9EURO|nr:hypothetical protein BO80DRAFT_72319 [Aspergillus ibericus CBS 121593]RAL01193.1 hypothetical protein BO80DRAFT_72319 [Aspergillus ibericus CBS 121593]
MEVGVQMAMKECGVCAGRRRSLAGKGPLDRSFQAPLSVGEGLMSQPERGRFRKGKSISQGRNHGQQQGWERAAGGRSSIMALERARPDGIPSEKSERMKRGKINKNALLNDGSAEKSD